ARAEVEQCIAHDGVIDHVGVMAVFENEHSRRLRGHGLCRFTRSWSGWSVSFPRELSRIAMLDWRLCVSPARSADVVGVNGVIVGFLVVGDGIRNRVWDVAANGEIGVIPAAVVPPRGLTTREMMARELTTATKKHRLILVRRKEEVGTAVSKNRPAVAKTVWPKGRDAGSDTGIGIVTPTETE